MKVVQCFLHSSTRACESERLVLNYTWTPLILLWREKEWGSSQWQGQTHWCLSVSQPVCLSVYLALVSGKPTLGANWLGHNLRGVLRQWPLLAHHHHQWEAGVSVTGCRAYQNTHTDMVMKWRLGRRRDWEQEVMIYTETAAVEVLAETTAENR